MDRVVFSMINRNIKFELDKNGMIARDSRNKLIKGILERLNTPLKFRGKERTFDELLYHQVRQIGAFLKDDISRYQAYIGKW